MKQKEEKGALDQQVFKKIFFIIALLFSFNSFASEAGIKKVEDYFNNIKYITSNFIQDDITNSQLSEGMFYISRPGKLRLDYVNPFEANLYTNNSVTVYYDKELDEISNIPTSTTPLHFLLKKEISFKDNSIKVIDFKETNDSIEISLKETEKENQGTLVLKFKKNPMEIKSIKLTNELGQEIEISLFNIKTTPIKDSVFVFKNPRLKIN